ncbi:MAG: HNH endonuclease [Mycoplasmataceae bacterium]|nr:HNH endonuclease [Mycoplasmataceae bacterium]
MNEYQTKRLKSIFEKYLNIRIKTIDGDNIELIDDKNTSITRLLYMMKSKKIDQYEKEFLNSLKTTKKTTSASTKRGAISSKSRKIVNERDSKECQYCSSKENIELAHITSRGAGGSGTPNNLISLCRKHHKTLDNPIGFNAIKEQRKIKEFIESWK